jgi:hypothetical protein
LVIAERSKKEQNAGGREGNFTYRGPGELLAFRTSWQTLNTEHSGSAPAPRFASLVTQYFSGGNVKPTEMGTLILTQAVITLFAILLAYVKLKQEIRKSRNEKVYELRLDRLKRQLSEFYGPLHMLTRSTTDIAKKAWGTDIWERVWKEIILPAHQQIEVILLTKIDLLEEPEIPQSYFDFLTHFKVNRSYLETGFGLSYFEKETPYPANFNQDISVAYDRKRKQYLELLQSVGLAA